MFVGFLLAALRFVLGFLIATGFRGCRGGGLRLLDHAALGADGFHIGSFLIHSAVRGDLCADGLHRIGRLIILIVKQELVKLNHIALQSLRDDAIALFAHAQVAPCLGKACGISKMIFVNIFQGDKNIIHPQAGRHLGEHRAQYPVQRIKIRLLRLLKGQLDDLSLPLGAGIIRIHQAQSSIGHRLHAV